MNNRKGTCQLQRLYNSTASHPTSRLYKSRTKGSKIDPCGTPEVIPFQDQFWPFNSTLCFRYFKKSFKRFNRFPDIPLRLNFRISSSCQTSSKALDMSKNTPLISRSLYQKINIFHGWQKGVDLCKSHRKILTGWMVVSHFH